MKKSILFSLLLCIVAFSASAQRYFDLIKADTLTNQDTLIFTTSPVLIDVPYYYSIHVACDSLSGATAGTAYLQVCNDRTGTNWYSVQSLTIDGTLSEALWEGILYARRVRLYFITPSGTRSVQARAYGSFKRIQ